MTDLPQQSNSAPTPPPAQPSVISSSGGNKEGEGIRIASPEMPLKGVGQEVTLPKEVQQAGVQVRPTTVPLPPQMQQIGVQSVGANVPTQPTNGSSITLPLTDEQIAQVLHQSVGESIRWLAEWCKRQILIVHAKVKRT